MKVLVNGIGNIGTTVLALLKKYQDVLNIDEVYALKNTPMPWHQADLEQLEELGIQLCTRTDDQFLDINNIIDSIDYIFDCTGNGGGIKNKQWYDSLNNLKGACAQGSEKHFGTSFMSGVNNQIITGQKYAHIVSCNTHSIASLLTCFAGKELENLIESDFVIVRRSEDLGNHQRLVSANVVARHLDDQLGTHHSIDVLDLFKTKGQTFKVTSSDVTTPSQLMHGVRFNLRLKTPINQEQIDQNINDQAYISYSTKFDSNVIFERGRRNGFQGRIYSHAVIISNNILCVDDRIMGWAFIPQEGNTILSTIHSFLLQTQQNEPEEIMRKLRDDLLRKHW